MSTQKNRPVLFELVKNRASSGATTWRAPLPAKLQAKQRAAEGDAPATPSTTPVRTPAGQSSWTLPMPAFAYEASGGQIRLGMNVTAAIISGVALLGVLFGAYQIGRATAGPASAAPGGGLPATTAPASTDKPVVVTPPSAGDRGKVQTPVRTPEQTSDRRQPPDSPPPRRDGNEPKPDPRVVEPARPNPVPGPTTLPANDKPAQEAAKPTAEPPSDAPEMKKGYHYLVIQHFRKTDTETADAAARFLIANGVPCAVQVMKADIRVIASEAFLIENQKDPVRKEQQGRANDLIRKVKQLGKEFAKTHGYAFDQCELRLLK